MGPYDFGVYIPRFSSVSRPPTLVIPALDISQGNTAWPLEPAPFHGHGRRPSLKNPFNLSLAGVTFISRITDTIMRDMIDEEWRYFAPGGALTPGGPSTWFILDWDQRHIIAVTMEEEQDSEDIAIEHLKKHIDGLGTDVYAIELSQDGELVSVSTDPKDDQGACVYYPPLEAIQRPDHVRTVLRSDLLELDRFSPNVDLVSYTKGANTKDTTKAVFKYYFLFQFIYKIWHEMNLWIRLPTHPNIVPFDRLVLDELHGHVVGFTSHYIPGGTLSENPSRVFKLKWLWQLTCVIDDLNLKYGIAHQDVAPRNLLILERPSLIFFVNALQGIRATPLWPSVDLSLAPACPFSEMTVNVHTERGVSGIAFPLPGPTVVGTSWREC
jgi:hypothetical protein